MFEILIYVLQVLLQFFVYCDGCGDSVNGGVGSSGFVSGYKNNYFLCNICFFWLLDSFIIIWF